jgi:hypothetical protein
MDGKEAVISMIHRDSQGIRFWERGIYAYALGLSKGFKGRCLQTAKTREKGKGGSWKRSILEQGEGRTEGGNPYYAMHTVDRRDRALLFRQSSKVAAKGASRLTRSGVLDGGEFDPKSCKVKLPM